LGAGLQWAWKTAGTRRALLDEGTLCDLFARRRGPTFGSLRALCQALDISMEVVIKFS
jgi:hypothetical protein